jgi:hypothetical protein
MMAVWQRPKPRLGVAEAKPIRTNKNDKYSYKTMR